jgi:hypothetical protein
MVGKDPLGRGVAIATDHPNPPTIDHPATTLGPRCAIAIRPFAIISKKPKAILRH